MEKLAINKFYELPKEKTSWYILGLGAVLILGIALFTFELFNPPQLILGMYKGEYVMMLIYRLVIILIMECAIYIPNLILGIRTYKRGERSWVFWLGFLPAILITIFLILSIILFFIQLLSMGLSLLTSYN